MEDMRVLRGLQETIARALKDEILITPKVELVQHNSLPAPRQGPTSSTSARRAEGVRLGWRRRNFLEKVSPPPPALSPSPLQRLSYLSNSRKTVPHLNRPNGCIEP